MCRPSSLILKSVSHVCNRPFLTFACQIWAAAVDPKLTDDGLISPGLGDTVRSRYSGSQYELELNALAG